MRPRPSPLHSLPIILAALALLMPTGCRLPQSRPPVAIWVVGGDAELTHNTRPNAENDVYSATHGRIRLQAALNETVALQVALRTSARRAGPFTLVVSDLRGPDDTLEAHAAVSIYRVHYTEIDTYRSWYPEHTGQPATRTIFPDILVPWNAPRGGGPVDVSPGRNAIVWIDIHVPPTISPGEYRGRLELRNAGRAPAVFGCDIELHVLPVALPGPRTLPAICRVDPRDLLRTHVQWPASTAEQTSILPGVPSHDIATRLVRATMQLLHDHRATPILWASFPKFRATSDRQVEIHWDEYDRLVGPWLDGTAFPDGVPLAAWPLPAALDYPDAERNGGLDSPRYARLLAGYLAECRRHFAERGWLDRAFFRPCPPEPLSRGLVDRMRRLTGIAVQSETQFPVVAHLPARSLRGLGWHEAPPIDLPDVSIWAPPAMWFEPDAMQQQRQLNRRTWLMPDQPPYSGSLAIEAPPTDAHSLPWQAYRYDIDALWIEHAADNRATSGPGSGAPLVYPGEPYGLHDQPVPTVRLKRLRRGLQDYELLRLLEDNGQQLLARRLAEQIVRWACTEAAGEDLLSHRQSGWPRDGSAFHLARQLMLHELGGRLASDPDDRRRQTHAESQWGLMMNQARRVVPTVEGVRLTMTPAGLRGTVLATVLNATDQTIEGRWTLPTPPPSWSPAEEVRATLPPGTQRLAHITLDLGGLAYNVDGAYPFELSLDTETLGAFRVPARLAVAASRQVTTPPRIDGALDDWPLATNNAAGDFRLCLRTTDGETTDRPELGTRAYFCQDQQFVYFAVRCSLAPGEAPHWQPSNEVPIDGAVPWGQDVVEIILDPTGAATTSSDLYCLQIKPGGLLVARRGCRTDPPTGTVHEWPSGARVAAGITPDAWIVELAIPRASFDTRIPHNAIWGCNITRLDARRGEYSSWSGARGHCYNPAALGNLLMLRP